MEILSWNTNGLRATYKNGCMDWFFDEKPDVLCLQETKATKEQLPYSLRDPEGYHCYFDSSSKLKGYAGVAIYSKVEPDHVSTNFHGHFSGEGRIIQADYENFKLINIYVPSAAGNTKHEKEEKLKRKFHFFEVFIDYMRELADNGENIIVCGDFNIAHQEVDLSNPDIACRNPGFLPEERKLIDTIINTGCTDTYRMFHKGPGNYTWWPNGNNRRERNIGMRLDHFFITNNQIDLLMDAYTRPDIKGSDHCPIGIKIEI